MNLDSRTATVAATILSTCALLTVKITLPLFFQKVQRTNTILMANVYNCHQHSNDIWHQLAHENVRGKRSAYGMGASKLQAGQCCSCQMGGPGMPGPQGEDGRPGMIGRNGANGRDGKYIVIETPDEEKHCQKCGPAPPGSFRPWA
ncbi:hypothetical protein WR25_14488 [Diploscapter pachys]|uniref:Nematode cuticle collagen N-terminal domain-containing protein n=1 Tax=Diploscapter pachys TaxID=2018661 RepID=A0A2A2KXN9_9BILA|nr:hypothetical protein WR25_14488 [Diploscapter pachys]